MDAAKKYLLIDSNNINQLSKIVSRQPDENVNQKTSERLRPIREKEIRSLDRVMLAIVNDESLNDDQKVDAYNKALTEFRVLTKTIPSTTTISETIDTQPPRTLSKNDYDPLLGIPAKYQRKASALIQFLRDTGKWRVLSSGNVSINNRVVEGSNASDIINHAVNPSSKTTDEHSWNAFASLLKETNAPKLLLKTNIKEEKPPTLAQSPAFSPTVHPRAKKIVKDWIEHDAAKTPKKKRKAKS